MRESPKELDLLQRCDRPAGPQTTEPRSKEVHVNEDTLALVIESRPWRALTLPLYTRGTRRREFQDKNEVHIKEEDGCTACVWCGTQQAEQSHSLTCFCKAALATSTMDYCRSTENCCNSMLIAGSIYLQPPGIGTFSPP
jgi:hypothetical protein